MEFLYREPMRMGSGEVPADFLARMKESPQIPHTADPFALPDSLKSSSFQ